MKGTSPYYKYLLCLILMLVPCLPQAKNTDAPYQLMLEDIEKAVSDALNEANVAPYVRATLTSSREKILYSGNQPAHVELKTLRYDTSRHSWSANMLIVDKDTVITARPIAGLYSEQQSLPVLKKRMLGGAVISASDVAQQFFPVAKVRPDTVTSIDTLIGKTPRRMISPNRPVREGEVTTPAIIAKGSVITMRYQTAYMDISTMGEAQEPGSVGDYIRVRNQDSNKTVRARVTAPDEVLVGSIDTGEITP
jgi:flagellar basal body P-ring formation protein FlgA